MALTEFVFPLHLEILWNCCYSSIFFAVQLLNNQICFLIHITVDNNFCLTSLRLLIRGTLFSWCALYPALYPMPNLPRVLQPQDVMTIRGNCLWSAVIECNTWLLYCCTAMLSNLRTSFSSNCCSIAFCMGTFTLHPASNCSVTSKAAAFASNYVHVLSSAPEWIHWNSLGVARCVLSFVVVLHCLCLFNS